MVERVEDTRYEHSNTENSSRVPRSRQHGRRQVSRNVDERARLFWVGIKTPTVRSALLAMTGVIELRRAPPQLEREAAADKTYQGTE